MTHQKFQQGDVVEKRSGYKWPGVVNAVFRTLKGETRVVVECTVPEVAGALHIYSPEQLDLMTTWEKALHHVPAANEELVEKVARAMWDKEQSQFFHAQRWDCADEEDRHRFRELARSALEAAGVLK